MHGDKDVDSRLQDIHCIYSKDSNFIRYGLLNSPLRGNFHKYCNF